MVLQKLIVSLNCLRSLNLEPDNLIKNSTYRFKNIGYLINYEHQFDLENFFWLGKKLDGNFIGLIWFVS